MELVQNEKGRHAISFKNLVITCDAEAKKTSIMVDGKEFGHDCNEICFRHIPDKDVIILHEIMRLVPEE